jgi:hypothetical protein
MNYRYESESGTCLDNPSQDVMDQLLAQLDGVSNSYASLTAPDGSYVQAGGGPAAFTVERREIREDGTFRHLKAALPSGEHGERRLVIGGSSVSVRADHLVQLPTVQQIFRSFGKGLTPPPIVMWQDITSMFLEAT